tara:strand:- start:264 stop:875 length:612 start_codon:yes stop_codon:yes gene_type:complete
MAVVSNGTTIIDAGALGVGGGSLVKIKTLTASDSSTLTFHNGTSDVVFDNTYDEYIIVCNNIHCETDEQWLYFQFNAVGASGFNETITSTTFSVANDESGSSTFQYEAGNDQAQGTAFQRFGWEQGNGADESSTAVLHIYAPSDTTFIKHFIAQNMVYHPGNHAFRGFLAGFINTTAAIDEVQFKMTSGVMQTGTITLYGVKG